MRFETVLFDLDGTLIDSGHLILASFRFATQTVLGRAIPDQVLMANVGGHGIHAQMRAFDAERADALVDAYREHNLAIHQQVRVFPGIVAELERLQSARCRLGIVTVKSRATVDVTFDVVPIRRFFETVVTGDDTDQHKPEPDPLFLALEYLSATPASAAYVGDSPFDIRAAKAAGMAAVAVGWGKIHSVDRLESERPDFVVRVPEELADVL